MEVQCTFLNEEGEKSVVSTWKDDLKWLILS